MECLHCVVYLLMAEGPWRLNDVAQVTRLHETGAVTARAEGFRAMCNVLVARVPRLYPLQPAASWRTSAGHPPARWVQLAPHAGGLALQCHQCPVMCAMLFHWSICSGHFDSLRRPPLLPKPAPSRYPWLQAGRGTPKASSAICARMLARWFETI
jgi:hypothetical protein